MRAITWRKQGIHGDIKGLQVDHTEGKRSRWKKTKDTLENDRRIKKFSVCL